MRMPTGQLSSSQGETCHASESPCTTVAGIAKYDLTNSQNTLLSRLTEVFKMNHTISYLCSSL